MQSEVFSANAEPAQQHVWILGPSKDAHLNHSAAALSRKMDALRERHCMYSHTKQHPSPLLRTMLEQYHWLAYHVSWRCVRHLARAPVLPTLVCTLFLVHIGWTPVSFIPTPANLHRHFFSQQT